MIFNNKKGFSVLEILMVITIIIILTAMVAPNFTKRTKQARMTVAKVDVEVNISQALDTYEMDNGFYPTTEQGLSALFKKPSSSPVPRNWNGPYLKKNKTPVDPWKNPYFYRFPGIENTEDYDLLSYGPDGIESEDDIVNWYEE